MELTEGLRSVLCLSSCPLILGTTIITVLLIESKKNTGRKITLTMLVTGGFIIVCSLVGMSAYFSGAPSPLFKPSVSSIEGTYYIKDPTLKDLNEEGYPLLKSSDCFIKFNYDKTLEVQNMPDIVISEFKFSPRHIFWSGKGTWDLDFDSVNGEWNITFQFTDNTNGSIKSYLWIYGRESPFVLYSIIGDPDDYTWIMYFKE
jgi:hypothetical protein